MADEIKTETVKEPEVKEPEKKEPAKPQAEKKPDDKKPDDKKPADEKKPAVTPDADKKADDAKESEPKDSGCGETSVTDVVSFDNDDATSDCQEAAAKPTATGSAVKPAAERVGARVFAGLAMIAFLSSGSILLAAHAQETLGAILIALGIAVLLVHMILNALRK